MFWKSLIFNEKHYYYNTEKKTCFFVLPTHDTSVIKKNIKFHSIDGLAKNMYPVGIPLFSCYTAKARELPRNHFRFSTMLALGASVATSEAFLLIRIWLGARTLYRFRVPNKLNTAAATLFPSVEKFPRTRTSRILKTWSVIIKIAHSKST